MDKHIEYLTKYSITKLTVNISVETLARRYRNEGTEKLTMQR